MAKKVYLCKKLKTDRRMKNCVRDLFGEMKWYDRAEYATMLLMTAAVPIDWHAGVWCLIGLCGVEVVKWVACRRVGNPAAGRWARTGLWLMVGYYALCALSALWSSHPDEARARAVLMLPMGVLPLVFLLSDMSYLRRRHVDVLAGVLAGVLTVRFVVMAIRAVVRYAQGVPPSMLIDYHFDALHHNYLALYLIAAVGLLYVVVERRWNDARWKGWRWAVAADMALLAGYMVVMGSRSGLVVMALLAAGCLAHMALVRRRWKATLVAAALLATGVAGTYMAAPKLYWRIVYSAERMLAGQTGDGRQVMWRCGMELVEGHALWGWGCDGYWEELRERYRAHDFAEGYEPERYNTHNMYLETLLMTGAAGLALLLAMMAAPVAGAFAGRRRNLRMVLFTVVYGGFLMFEVMFERQMGLLFICWWYGLLAVGGNLEETGGEKC